MTENLKDNYVVLLNRRDYKSKEGRDFTAISMLRVKDLKLIERSLPKSQADDLDPGLFGGQDGKGVLCEAILEDRGFSMSLIGFEAVGSVEIKTNITN